MYDRSRQTGYWIPAWSLSLSSQTAHVTLLSPSLSSSFIRLTSCWDVCCLLWVYTLFISLWYESELSQIGSCQAFPWRCSSGTWRAFSWGSICCEEESYVKPVQHNKIARVRPPPVPLPACLPAMPSSPGLVVDFKFSMSSPHCIKLSRCIIIWAVLNVMIPSAGEHYTVGRCDGADVRVL